MHATTIGAWCGSLTRDPEAVENSIQLIRRDLHHREMRCLERRSDSRLTFQRPVAVVILQDDTEALLVSDEPSILAYTRDISATGVGLLHDRPIGNRRVLLSFDLLGGRMIAVLASISWCRYLGDFWYSSGGRLLGVITIDVGSSSIRGWHE